MGYERPRITSNYAPSLGLKISRLICDCEDSEINSLSFKEATKLLENNLPLPEKGEETEYQRFKIEAMELILWGYEIYVENLEEI